jgi:hypothetical protein
MYKPDSYEELLYPGPPTTPTEKPGYPWLFVYMRRPWLKSLAIFCLVVGLSAAFYMWYNQTGNSTSPDGSVGLVFALAGTACFVMAAVLYSLRRRLRKRAIGQLNASLNWHVLLALMGVVFILIHSFGNFNPISGTYALIGLIALSLSGLVGRALDRILPRLIAAEVSTVLTAQGDDRITNVSQKLQAIVVHNTQKKLRGFNLNASAHVNMQAPGPKANAASRATITLHTPQDLAYISLEPTQQELDRDAPHYRFIPDKKSALNRPGALIPGAQEHMAALDELHTTLQREQLYRSIIRAWRMLHIALAVLTTGLIIWHIIFAMHIMFPTIFPI